MKLSVKLSVLSKHNHAKLKQRSIISTLLMIMVMIKSTNVSAMYTAVCLESHALVEISA